MSPETVTTYVTIGNSDDRLTQAEWAAYYATVDSLVGRYASEVYGRWVSLPTHRWQNACWGFSLLRHRAEFMRAELALAAGRHRQDSIAWVEGVPDFLAPA